MDAPRRAPGNLRRSGWRWAVGGLLLVILVLVVGPEEIWQTVRGASFRWAAVVLATAGLWLFVGGLNVWILLRRLARVRLTTFLRIYAASWAASLLLPGQLGDATQIILLRRHGVSADQSGAAYVVDKVFSLTWMLLVAVSGAALYLPPLGYRIWLFLVPLALIPLGFLGLYLIRFATKDRDGLVARARRWIDRLTGQLRKFLRFPGTLCLNLALTVFKWLAMAWIYLASFRAFGAPVPFAQASTIPVMSSLVGYIPITVGGAGTMEWSAVALFDRLGVEPATVVSAFLLPRLLLLTAGLVLIVGVRGLRAGGQGSSTSSGREALPSSTGSAGELQENSLSVRPSR